MLDEHLYRKGEPRLETRHSNLPHWHQDGVYVFVTWGLRDAVPANLLVEVSCAREDLRRLRKRGVPDAKAELRLRVAERKIGRQQDEGLGNCLLRKPEAARVVAEAIQFFDGKRYQLDCFVVMPNHVHVLFILHDAYPLSTVLHSWKSFTANQLAMGFGGKPHVWHEGFWDTLIRSPLHLRAVRNYIAGNPAKARLPVESFIYWEAPDRPIVES